MIRGVEFALTFIKYARTLWGHDALFDYQDRYMQVTASDGDYPGWRSWNNFTAAMWDTSRADYGPVWSAN